jgi:hypothetical protein
MSFGQQCFRAYRIAALFCFAGALFILGLAVWTNQALTADGHIVAVREMAPRGLSIEPTTVISVSFTDAAGRTQTVPIVYMPRRGVSLKKAQLGGRVTLAYHLRQPEKADLDVFRRHDLYGMTIAFVTLMGLVIFFSLRGWRTA